MRLIKSIRTWMLVGFLWTICELCGGCSIIRDMGLGALPVYDCPEAVFSAVEKTMLERWKKEDEGLFKKWQKLSLDRKAVIETHNNFAMKKNKERLEALGFDVETRGNTMTATSPKKG